MSIQQASIGNGAMAIFAGIVAQVLEDTFGHIGPFQGAIALTTLALVLVLGWNENYGEETSTATEKKPTDENTGSLYKQFIDGWVTTVSDSRVWRIGLTQALSEGAMYTVRMFYTLVVMLLYMSMMLVFKAINVPNNGHTNLTKLFT